MANFQTHFNVASFVSAIGAGVAYYSSLVDKPEAVLLFAGGIIGGVLPDIDSDNSTPTKIMQYIFANLISLFVLFKYIGVYPIGNLILIWIGSFIVSMFLFYLFNQLTHHRGMFHSIPAAFVAWFSFSLVFYYVFHYDYLISWYFGMFIFIGYITHLLLDEIYSVDLSNAKIKRSFGSALKLFNKDYKTVVIFYLLAGVLYFAMPYKKSFVNSFSKFDIIATYHKLLRNKER